MRREISCSIATCAMLWLLSPVLMAEPEAAGGIIRGKVVHAENDQPVHGVTILIVQLGRATDSGDNGSYEFRQVPPGKYDVVVHSAALADERQQVVVADGAVSTADFRMRVAPIRSEITVTASGSAVTTFEAFQAVRTMDAIDLAAQTHTSIGEVLDGLSGVAKRSFGPGNTRPVIRGFDGDRVLVMLDGMPGGSLASQSGDHGENLDVLQLERVEVVKGPATLLYGSNAVGGVVNAVTGHHQIQEHPHEGLTGYVTGVGGTANAQGAGNAGFEYGRKHWMIWGGGGGQRTGDYDTPAGAVVNSRTRSRGGYGGFGLYGEKAYIRLGYNYDNRRYGIPFAAYLESGGESAQEEEQTNLRLDRHDVRFTGGIRDLSPLLNGVRIVLGYSKYRHGEYDAETIGTDFRNNEFNYRVAFDQKKIGRLSGNFGLSGMRRNYRAIGDEALAPPTIQSNVALFALETVEFEKLSLQFGGRFEHNRYNPDDGSEPPRPKRSFNGISAAAGVRIPLWKSGAFVTDFTHSYRAPALEELYNNGPHPGNLAFEIGNPQLRRELADGIDVSLRHHGERLRAEVNLFHYGINDFVFLAPTGKVVDSLFEAEFLQENSRFRGGEVSLDLGLNEYVWLRTGLDFVNARLTRSDEPLPRIPPLRGRAGIEFRYKNLVIRPEAVMTRSQDEVFVNENRTPGYALFDLNATYTIAQQHYVHVFAIETFNLGDRLYYNHLSFIKNLAPEIGRGVRISYTLRFF
jgi:iron complex outermembrane receptor protein